MDGVSIPYRYTKNDTQALKRTVWLGRFNPLQVHKKQHLSLGCLALLSCFNPLQVHKKLCIDIDADNECKEFQSPIGTQKTEMEDCTRSEKRKFQSPIGTQKTHEAYTCGSPIVGFNPLQVHKKLRDVIAGRRVSLPVVQFQSPIGTQKTYKKKKQYRYQKNVSIPYRYTKNSFLL